MAPPPLNLGVPIFKFTIPPFSNLGVLILITGLNTTPPPLIAGTVEFVEFAVVLEIVVETVGVVEVVEVEDHHHLN